MRIILAAAASLALGGCVASTLDRAEVPVEVKIIGLNDFHGALEPPRSSVTAEGPDGQAVRVPAGGIVYFASAIRALKAANPYNVVVSAGDLVSASPLISSYFLDEPTILAMNLVGLDFNAVGNHEFDRGRAELLRMQHGGCEKNGHGEPCRVDGDFPGAAFNFLAANVMTEEGETLFPAYGLRRFGSGSREVRVGFIGLTLKETPTLVTPAGVAGLSFGDEAESINAVVPHLREEGADAIVVLIHQGASTKVGYNDKGCAGMDGDLMPILSRLDPEVDLVISGHTHNAYVCDYGGIDPARPFLVTSAGRSGMLLTDITIAIDPIAGEVTSRQADNIIVQGEGYDSASGPVTVTPWFRTFPRDPAAAALVQRYADAVAPVSVRKVGTLSGPALREMTAAGETVLGNLVADAHLAATRAPEAGGAQIAFTNEAGLRADIIPSDDGSVTYGHLISAQPFGNNLVVKSFTGSQIRALLEQQFASGTNTIQAPVMLQPSEGFFFRYDLSRPAGERIVDMRLGGRPLDESAAYRVAMNSFLASGGDNFTVFREGTRPVGGPLDVEALERHIAGVERRVLPVLGRIERVQ